MSPAKRYRPCVLATCCVPWREDFTFAEDIFRRSVRRLDRAGHPRSLHLRNRGRGLRGHGDAVRCHHPRLSGGDARRRACRSMVGLISLSLPAIIERIERARDDGCAAVSIEPSQLGRPARCGDGHVFPRDLRAVSATASSSTTTSCAPGRILTGAEYGRLAAEHPNLVATKNSTADEARLRSLMTDAPQLQHFITEGGFARAPRWASAVSSSPSLPRTSRSPWPTSAPVMSGTSPSSPQLRLELRRSRLICAPPAPAATRAHGWRVRQDVLPPPRRRFPAAPAAAL